MISIVVYGRNDNYGYNLHKRAAISLNCLAELLRHADDELIFVDYNTPDDLPTFPEAIADTLTAQSRSVLRILRVRPEIHLRYAAKTPLLALEAVARNVGIRRSNPGNRWVLSTNTDIVLVLRQARDLAELVRALPSGFYHTPRFEIPESLWESFDRGAPERIIEDVRALGKSARLNEVVYGADTILYDGPGDFQLVERATLFAIDGFDQRMLRAWHLDSNISKRLSLYCGPVRSLIKHVYCYHCDHTRQVTPAHDSGNAGNDSKRFVDEVACADLPEQRESWGCGPDTIEEIRLPEAARNRYRDVLNAVVAPLDRDFTEAVYAERTYGSYQYDAAHVLPFLADLLNYAPRQSRLAWCGLGRDMFQLFCQAWRELGFERPIAVHRSVERYLLPSLPEGVEILGPEAWLCEADLFAFEFGYPQYGSDNGEAGPQIALTDDERAEAIAVVESTFLVAVSDERCRQTEAAVPPRRFIGINCIHNRSEGVFGAHVAAALTPFGSHLRHGFVAKAADPRERDIYVRSLIGHALGRLGPISRKELAFAEELVAPLLSGEPITPDIEHRIACHGSFGRAFLTVERELSAGAPTAEMVERMLARLENLRPSTELAASLGVPVHDLTPSSVTMRPLSRFACYEDWDDPSWCAYTGHYITDPDANLAYRRDAARWEQVHLLYGLGGVNLPRGQARLLVIATMPDAVIAALTRWAGQVELFGITASASAGGSRARAFWCNGAGYAPESLRVLPAATRIEQLDRAAYDVVVFPHGAMLANGLTAALAWMRIAEELLRQGGVLAFKAELAAGARPHPDHLDVRALGENGFAAQLAQHTGFVVSNGFDKNLSRATVDKVWPDDGPLAGEGYFLSRQDGRVLIPSYWFLTKRQGAESPDWDPLREWLLLRCCGEQLPALLPGAAGMRCEDGLIASIPDKQGHVFFGPYLPVAPGRYSVALRLRKPAGPGRSASADLEAVVGESVLASKRIAGSDWRAGTVALEFEVPGPMDGVTAPLLEIRLHSPGGLGLIVESLDLQLHQLYSLGDWPELPVVGCLAGDKAEEAARRGSATDATIGSPEQGMQSVDQNAGEVQRGTDGAAAGSGEACSRDDRFSAKERAEDIAPPPHELNRVGASRSLTRVIADADWDDPAWNRFLDPSVIEAVASGERRDSSLWERTHILYGLDRLGKLTGSERVLVAATMPDEMIGLLSEYVSRVEVLDLKDSSSRRGAQARLFWSNGGLYARDRVVVHERAFAPDQLAAASYDAVLFPHGAMFFAGIAGIARLMQRAEQLLRPDGVLVFKADILVDGSSDGDHLDLDLIAGGNGLASRIEAETGFTVQAGPGERDLSAVALVAKSIGGNGSRRAVPSIWFLSRRGDTREGGWKRLEDWLVGRLLGEQLPRLQLGPAGRRDNSGRILTSGIGKGRIFFGPYVGLPVGRYEAVLDIAAPATNGRGRVTCDVTAGGRLLRKETVDLAPGRDVTARLPFAIPGTGGAVVEKVEVRAWLDAGEAAFTGCRIEASQG